MRAAIYARVSTGRQERDQTIDGQLAALRQWATEQGHELRPEHVFTDEGYPGARLPAAVLRGNRCNRSFGWVNSTPEVPAAPGGVHLGKSG
jgi:site-specific DNA recombinase